MIKCYLRAPRLYSIEVYTDNHSMALVEAQLEATRAGLHLIGPILAVINGGKK